MLNNSPQLDRAFQALSDPVRRGMLARLAAGPASVSELAAPLPMSLPGVLQHLKALEAERPGPIREEGPGADRAAGARRRSSAAESWIAERRAEWEAQLDRFEDYLQTLKKNGEDMMAEDLDLVLERTLDAPVDLVWEAYTNPEHLKRWFAPRPYEISEIELDLQSGRDLPHPHGRARWVRHRSRHAGCVLEVVERREARVDQRARPRIPARTRPARAAKSFPMTAIITFADAGDGKTHYKAVALHKDVADRDDPREDGIPRRLGHRRRPARGVRAKPCDDGLALGCCRRNAPESFDSGASLVM